MSKGSDKRFDKMSLAKKIEKMRREPDLFKLGFYNRMSEAERAEAIKKIPGLEFLVEINAGNTGSTSKRQGGSVNVATTQPWQYELAKNAGRLSQTGLEDTLNQLNQPYESPINKQMEQIFGHLQNPILQGLINPQQQNMPRVMFPDQLNQEYQQNQQYQQQNPGQYGQWNPQGQYEQPGSPIQDLLGALGRHAFKQHGQPWLDELQPEDLQQAYGQYLEPGLNRAYQGAQNAYGGLQNASQWGQDKLNFLRTLPGEARNDISSLLSRLGSYIPGKTQKNSQ